MTDEDPAQEPDDLKNKMVRRVAVAVVLIALLLGVFSSTANAEEVRAKLELNGFQPSVEARVQVGPYATRKEAGEAQARLKELGLVTGILIAPATKGRAPAKGRENSATKKPAQ